MIRRLRTGARARPVSLGVLVVTIAALGGCGGSGGSAKLPLQTVAELPLPGGSSRFDYQSVDPSANQLFIAHLGAGSVTIVDTEGRRVVTDVGNIAEAHGVYAVPELGVAFASATGTNELVAIDAKRGRVLRRTPTGSFPDGVTYEPSTKRVFVSDKDGGTLTAISAARGEPVGKVDLGGEVGNVQYDPGSRKVLANAQGSGELVSVDPGSLRVEKRLSLPGCEGNHGLLIDADSRRAFIACENNARLLVVDLDAMRVLQDLAVGDGPDVLAFDPSLRRLYVASESGVVSAFEEKAGKLTKLGEEALAPSAHTVAVDPRTHLVYFPLEDVGGQPVLRIMKPSS